MHTLNRQFLERNKNDLTGDVADTDTKSPKTNPTETFPW